MLHELVKVWFGWVENWGYTGVFLLMAMESSIIPVPSELVMPAAAFWSAQGKSELSLVILAGTAGSWFGSAVSYWVSRWVGIPVLTRFGRYVGITPEKLAQGQNWVSDYGVGGIFVARLLPVVRHLVSIPAGFLKMPFGRFSVVTTVGAGLWCAVLSFWGEKVIGAHPELLQSPELMIHAVKSELLSFVGGVVVLGGAYLVVVYLKRKASKPSALSAV